MPVKADDISEAICEAINDATFLNGDWQEVCRRFVHACPETYIAILNHNKRDDKLGYAVAAGLDTGHFSDFLDYYASINPWRHFWQNAPSGTIAVAERDDPVSQFRESEFYNDWMCKVGDFDASVGLRLEVDIYESIVIPIHYSPRLSQDYGPLLEQVMGQVKDSLLNVSRVLRLSRQVGENCAAAAALVDQAGSVAFVLDRDLKVLNANREAEQAFAEGTLVRFRSGRAIFLNESLQKQICAKLRYSPELFENLHARYFLNFADHRWLVTLNQLPASSHGLLRNKAQYLCRIEKITPLHTPSYALLIEAFELTAKEAELCCLLCAERSLSRAASLASISYENARQRMKSIYRKTGAMSQADLMMLLRRL